MECPVPHRKRMTGGRQREDHVGKDLILLCICLFACPEAESDKAIDKKHRGLGCQAAPHLWKVVKAVNKL